ncbi:hypothetical protein MUP79_05280 [Candidatus Bathyarchaeota archaeon]|jgi:hypothetical protein|nr:hypothetical protein [Candidatus Bathyarchaeota archaeon]
MSEKRMKKKGTVSPSGTSLEVHFRPYPLARDLDTIFDQFSARAFLFEVNSHFGK